MAMKYDYERSMISSYFDAVFYLSQFADIETAPTDPIAHYLEHGWKEMLDPSPNFSTSFYLYSNDDVRRAGINPLLHYAESGRLDGRSTHQNQNRAGTGRGSYEKELLSPWFDTEFYLSQLDEEAKGSDPVLHYFEQGWRELKDPSKNFSTSYYLDTHADVRAKGINPLLHYAESGIREGRAVRNSSLTLSNDVEISASLFEEKEARPGRGSDEQDLLMRTNSLALSDHNPNDNADHFEADYKKHMIAPSLIETLTDPLLFDIDYYRFHHSISGSDLTAVAQFLKNPLQQASPYFDPEWYAEQYRSELDVSGLNALQHYLTIGRMKKLHPSAIFDGQKITFTPEQNKEIIEKSGLFDPIWYNHVNGDVARAGVDPLSHYSRVGANEFKRSPNVIFDNTFYVSQAPEVVQWRWNPLVHYIVLGSIKDLSTHLLVDVGWFKRTQSQPDAVGTVLKRMLEDIQRLRIGPNEWLDPVYYASQHPEATEYPGGLVNHFLEVGWKLKANPSERFNTSNYAEANPDVRIRNTNPLLHFIKNGRLEGRNPNPSPTNIPTTFERFSEPEYGAVGAAIKFDSPVELPENFSHSIAVHLHLYYSELAEEFCIYLSNIPVPFHLFVSVPPGRGDPEKLYEMFSKNIKYCTGVTIAQPYNRGRDVAPFLVEFGRQLLSYEIVLHLHSKRSPHSAKHAGWRRYLLHYTLGNRATVTQILTTFHVDPKVGIIQPPYHPEVRAQPKWGNNREIVMRLLARFGFSYLSDACPHFPAGSFFWARTDALRPLLDGRIKIEDFDEEKGQIDSTFAHAIERVFGLMPLLRSYSVVSRFIDVAHNLIDYYGKSRPYPAFEHDRSLDILEYQAAVRQRIKARGRIALVTAISGPFDALLLPYNLEASIDYFCVTDSITDGYGVFRLLPPPYLDADARRSARYVKTNLIRLFPGYDFVVWVDANVLIRSKVSDFVALTDASGCPVGAIAHPTRSSYRDEAQIAIEMKLDDAALIATQLDFYEGVEGLDHAELIETNFMVFDSRNPRTKQFMQTWWNQINTYSRRDQLSINYSLLKEDVRWHSLLPEFQSVRDSGKFSLFRHGLNEWGPKPHIYSAWHKANGNDGILLPLPSEHRWSKHIGRLDLDVVVCVHNALEDVRNCLASLDVALDGRGRVILVDDASEVETAEFLKQYAEKSSAILLRNEDRLGYTKAANAGVQAGTNRNVLLLNSDTIVPPMALDKLSDALDRDALLGIVGPLSNAASAQSVPSTIGTASQTAINALPSGMTPTDMDTFLERRWDGVIIRTPLVHGFCFCVKRAVFETVGLFDEENFPRGYGEENDFCFRTMDAGFDLGILTNTYVFHVKSKSYAEAERTQLMSEGMAALVRKATKSRISRSVATLNAQPGLALAREAVASLFEHPTSARQRKRNRLFVLPSLRSDGLPAGSGYVRTLLPYRTKAISEAWEFVQLRSESVPPIGGNDVVVVQRDAALIPITKLDGWISAIQEKGARLIYEIDDDLLDGPALRSRGFKGDTEEMASRVLRLARAADCVTVSSEALQKKFGTISRRVAYVPNALDADLWGLNADHPSGFHHIMNRGPGQKVVIGYIGTPTHDEDLALIEHTIAELDELLPGRIDVQIVGGFAPGKKKFGTIIPLPLANDYPSFVRWMRGSIRWDIGLIPLRHSSFNANKSYLKFLEFSALGMAVICSDGPEYTKVVQHGKTGLIVRNTQGEWRDSIFSLIRSADQRVKLARNAYEAVRNEHTLDGVVASQIINILS